MAKVVFMVAPLYYGVHYTSAITPRRRLLMEIIEMIQPLLINIKGCCKKQLL